MALSHLSKKKYIVILMITMCFLIIDRFLKNLALNFDGKKVLIKNVLDFSLIKNSNAAFSLSLGFDIVWLAIIITILALVWLGYTLQKKDNIKSLALIALVFGSASNIYDRIIHGAVIDYFDFANLSIFNLADCLIVIAAALLLYKEFKSQKGNQDYDQI